MVQPYGCSSCAIYFWVPYSHRHHADLDDDVFPRDGEGPPAAAFLRGAQRDLVRRVAAATGQHTYLVDHVLREMVARARDRKLRLAGDPADALVEAAVLLTSLSSHYSYGSHPRYQR